MINVFYPSSEIADFKEGQIILVDKPYRWTSFDVVNKIRSGLTYKIYGKKLKVGHAGTLDPLATGLLILCTGSYTKQIETIQNSDKVYSGTLFLGATTPSYDRETEVDKTFSTSHINEKLILQAADRLTGSIQQVPPRFSAIRINGKRAYNMARKSEEVKMKARDVQIHYFEITDIDLPLINFRVHCSKGTYIRSLAYDFGKMLQSGAYLYDLRRTDIGEFSIDQSISIETWINYVDQFNRAYPSQKEDKH